MVKKIVYGFYWMYCMCACVPRNLCVQYWYSMRVAGECEKPYDMKALYGRDSETEKPVKFRQHITSLIPRDVDWISIAYFVLLLISFPAPA